MKVRLRVTCRYTHAVQLRRDAKNDGECSDQALEGGYEEGEDECARGAAQALVSQSVAKASYRCQTLRMKLAWLQSLHAFIRIEDRVVTSKPACQK